MAKTVLWRVQLCDGPMLESASGESIRRFRSLKVGALLAYLALRLGRPCPREELCAALWPEEADRSVLANRLRVALSSLRRQLEPPGVLYGSVLDVSSQGRVCLREELVWCDVVAFERAVKAGQHAEAAALLTGPLLPGYYEDWVIQARERLAGWEKPQDWTTPPPPRNQDTLPFLLETQPLPPEAPLPLYLTRFFGRTAERALLESLLASNRLVTITGPGGIGKTRLAVEAAPLQPAPVVFVSLVDLMQGEDLVETILRAMRISPSAEEDLSGQLIAVLQRRGPVLLLLDNAEHLLPAVAALAVRLLQALPEIALLVTSRQGLEIAGEALLPLGPIENPTENEHDETVLQAPAVALFLDRARHVRPDFSPAGRHLAALQTICRLLEGVPLALELAAARVVLQTPSQIAESLESGVMQLKSHLHSFSPRHRSLRASIQGSFALLPPELQAFLCSLSVFRGGWTVEAAQVVTGCAQTEEFLEELARRSLLVSREDHFTGRLRCSFLESLRQFAAEQLGENERALRLRRHADYYLTLATQVTEDDYLTLHPLESEQENLIAALTHASEAPDVRFWEGLRGALLFGHLRGRNRAFLPWVERALSADPATLEPRLYDDLHFFSYRIISYMGQDERTRELGERLLRLSQERQDLYGQIHAKLILGYTLRFPGDWPRSLALTQEALQQARELQEHIVLNRCLRLRSWQMNTYAISSDIPGKNEYQQALQEGVALARECLERLPPRSAHRTNILLTLCYTLGGLGHTEEAYTALKAAQRTALLHRIDSMLIFSFMEECHNALDHGCHEYAALLLGAYLALRETTGYGVKDPTPREDRPRRELPEVLGVERFESLLQHGRQANPEAVAALSLRNIPGFSGFQTPLTTPTPKR